MKKTIITFILICCMTNLRAQNATVQDSIAFKITNRDFPSIFAAWNAGSEGLPPGPLNPSALSTVARHDLYWADFSRFGLRVAGNQQYLMEATSFEFTPESIRAALRRRAEVLAANPHTVILVNVHYNAANPKDFLPPESPIWLRNDQFDARNKEYGSHRLDFSNPAFQDKVAALCGALITTGVFDGCMLDGWHDDDNTAARISLIQKIRATIGEKALLVGNVNQRLPTQTANYLNGMYMEGFGAKFFPDWHLAAQNLLWGESHLRKPGITAFEGWWSAGRDQYPLMREVTTLALVFSNGYVVFSDPNELPTPDHLHDWYPIWDKSLGKPTAPLATLNRPDLNGAYTRAFEKGEVVYKPPSNREVTVRFDKPHLSAATGTTSMSFIVAPGDGNMFLNTGLH